VLPRPRRGWWPCLPAEVFLSLDNAVTATVSTPQVLKAGRNGCRHESHPPEPISAPAQHTDEQDDFDSRHDDNGRDYVTRVAEPPAAARLSIHLGTALFSHHDPLSMSIKRSTRALAETRSSGNLVIKAQPATISSSHHSSGIAVAVRPTRHPVTGQAKKAQRLTTTRLPEV
jgi:hypothetical protein